MVSPMSYKKEGWVAVMTPSSRAPASCSGLGRPKGSILKRGQIGSPHAPPILMQDGVPDVIQEGGLGRRHDAELARPRQLFRVGQAEVLDPQAGPDRKPPRPSDLDAGWCPRCHTRRRAGSPS